MNILKGLLFLQNSSIIDVRLSYIEASENIEIFKEKLSWSKLSRLLQRIAFPCSNILFASPDQLFFCSGQKNHQNLGRRIGKFQYYSF